jgi:alanine dehydrogenase
VLDRSLTRLQELDFQFGGRLNTVYATADTVEHYVLSAHLVIGAVLVPGAAAPKLVSHEMVKRMRPARCSWTSRSIRAAASRQQADDASNPTYIVDDVVHYCVANMPGAVARTSTLALNNATLPFTLALADKGHKKALARRSAPARGTQCLPRQGDLRSRRARSRLQVRAGDRRTQSGLSYLKRCRKTVQGLFK